MLTFLAEFLFSAVLWGSLITWWLWRWRKRVDSALGHRLLWLPLAWFGLHTAFAWYGFILPPSGRLVEDVSGQPIPNARVEVSWGAYPVLASIAQCPGFQAHLTDAEGDFSFPFAPLPTLFLGTLFRTINPMPPGRVRNGRARIFPVWLRGEIRIRHYQIGRPVFDFIHVGCESKFLPQHWGGLLRGEAYPFSVAYREACVEQRAWTLTDKFIRELVRYASVKGWHDPKEVVSRPPMPPDLNAKYNAFDQDPCSTGGVCASAIDATTRAEFCSYFTELIRTEGEEK